ncbi:MAG: diguanylate cyclase [Pseudomonadota bacterium]|nr:diguanylate cyclase [Pseudomonadota bacterium]MDP1904395.1 diguanylate cyclase [Pseudomonadota bacterium]MDP2351299.1 diguanylate cyclase [Pseudomonadota bacterium]
MTITEENYQAELAALRTEYADELPKRLREIDTLWQTLENGPWSPEALHKLHLHIHRLAGAGTTFGYAEMSKTARDLEKRLMAWLREPDRPGRPTWEAAKAQMAKLATAVGNGPQLAPGAAAPPPLSPMESRLIYLVEDDLALAEDFRLQLGRFGYAVRVFPSTEGVEAAVAEQRPDAMVLDVVLPEGNLAGTDLLREMRAHLDLGDVPVIFVTARDDFDARLAAIRAGADAYYHKPVDPMFLLDRLEHLTQREADAPFRILIVDDEAALAEHYALVLRQAGMQATSLTEPRQVLEWLAGNDVELLLTDLYMPECSGMELARLIRQDDRYLSLPIVFLSTEQALEQQLKAMSLGGDDFLGKPIEDRHLVTAVTIRARRARELRALMSQDSLTGLLTHARFKERLDAELARGQRKASAVTLALLDIDHFKRVNDEHGHLAGDRVLKTLANLLRRRIRRSDVVARYGGEEFAVIFNDCDEEDALHMLDTIREDFSAIQHGAREGAFQVTFSAGIAAADAGSRVGSLIEQADQNLYRAKDAGRNRIVAGDSTS